MAMQLNIDSSDIGGSGGRSLFGPVTESESGTVRTVSVGLKVAGDTVAATEAAWQAARAAISKDNARVTLTMDTTAGSYFVDEFPGNGRTRTTRCTLSKDESRISTGLAIYGTVVLTIDQTPVQAEGAVGPEDAQRVRFAGQAGDWRLVRTLNEGGIENRAMQVSFGTQFDQAAAGPLAFSAVVSEGGKARFQFAALTGVTVAKLRMIYVSGTADYDGPHEVASVDVINFRVTTRTAFSSDEAGTALFGQQTSPAEVYAAAQADVYDTLGVGSGGGRDSTTGLVLVGQTRDEQREILAITLAAEWIQEDYESSVRSLVLSHETMEVSEWSAEPDAGAAPLEVAATVSFHVDKGSTPDANYNPRALWAAIRAKVLTRLKDQTGAADANGPIDEKIRSDANSGNCVVTLTLRARNVTVLLLKRTYASKADLVYRAWVAGQYEYIQVDGVPVTKLVTATCVRVGVGEVELSVEAPTESGYTYVDITEELGINGKSSIRGIVGGAVIYAQSLTRVYRRFRFAPGASLRFRTPSSNGGATAAVPASPVTGGGGGVAPVAAPQPVPVPPAGVV